MPHRFDLAATPLHRGVNLIEASAGTGKTFTIAGLFVRLLVEHTVPVEEILVVTFTEAATSELRDRIRARLITARRAFETGIAPDDELLAALLERHRGQSREMAARLDLACREFDQAAIYTIHGFCQRVLKDRAFESGQLFDLELVTDPTPLLREVCDDFWRRHFYEASALRVNVALAHGLSPDSFAALLAAVLRHPDIELLPQLGKDAGDHAAGDLEAAFLQAAELWQRDEAEIRSHFGGHILWGNNPYNDDAKMAVHFANLAQIFAGEFTAETLKSLKEFTPAELVAGLKKKRPPNVQAPVHPFFDACATLLTAAAQFALATRLDLIRFARSELPARKNRAKAQTFDDLLTRLRDALASGDGADALAAALRQRFRAALIDEFQDTDPVQWEIFRRVFARDDRWLFLIGDPKQAIYSFRGADIFAYLGAAETTPEDRRFTLGTNWRSERALVAAVNTVFSHRANPFAVPQIAFAPVAACGRADETPLVENGVHRAPLRVWHYPAGDDGKAISTAAAAPELAEATATEIVRLLNGGATLGGRPVRPEDIAVLVDRNDQARLMQEVLTRRDVPAVIHATSSLFASHEAMELERVFASIAEPSNERLLKAALATDFLGVNGDQLDALSRDEVAWQERVARVHNDLAEWSRAGFIQMFRRLLQREQVRSRLLRLADGERRLTNVLHLGEVLHQAAVEQRLGINGVVKWLGEQRADDGERSEEFQLRLERDDNAVKLVTIHRSKGLEYPIVFVPFCWRNAELAGSRRKNTVPEVLFHAPEGARHIQRDLGSPDFERHTQLAQEERLAENLRLFYVALTRSKNRCTFAWGGFNNAASSAPAWLMHQPADAATAVSGEYARHFKALPDCAFEDALTTLAKRAAPIGEGGVTPVEFSALPEPDEASYRPPATPPAETLQPRSFTAHIPRDWRITSFSSLTAGGHEELPDRDSVAAAPAVAATLVESPITGIFTFPRGARPGTCLHELYEHLDFTETRVEAIESLVVEKLRAGGINADEFGAPVVQMVRRTLAVPLDPARPEFTLARVPRSARLNELEFYFPLKRIAPVTLRDVFARHSAAEPLEHFPERLGRLQFEPMAGFMKGFMDLVFEHEGRFYLIDWKSNWLGARVEDYGPAALREEMMARHYVLQYHLYVLALDRYLATRLRGYDYAHDFGGVGYVFLRGVDPARPELGVFRDRPKAELIHDLRSALLDWKESNA